MESRSTLFGHPIHQMLVPLPIGAFGLSVLMDGFYSVTGKREHARFARRAIDVGLVTAAVAAPFGVGDFLAIESGTRAKRVGRQHALTNLVMLGMFATSRLMRSGSSAPAAARYLSGAAFLASGVGAWFGGELLTRHGVGLSDRVGPDVPSSLEEGAPSTGEGLFESASRHSKRQEPRALQTEAPGTWQQPQSVDIDVSDIDVSDNG